MEFLNYHHLRYFWMVAREGGLRKAAEKLHLSQPTISAQVSALEQSIGEKLFRRSGRSMVLTEAGRRAFEVAQEIFSLGQEFMDHVRGHRASRALRLHAGISDSVPKLLAWEILAPAFSVKQPVQVNCREGSAEELLAALATGRLDVVIAGEPAPASLPVKVHSHALGHCGTAFCAPPALSRKLAKNFPASLHGAPMLLPQPNTAWRQLIDAWLHRQGVQPRAVAEFDDAALMKMAASAGLGIVPVPERVLADAKLRYGLVRVGLAKDCRVSYYAITVHQRVTHPAVAAMLRSMDRPAK
jgi:LysR family transcriptional regulator, transcriptional activator of nhaA